MKRLCSFVTLGVFMLLGMRSCSESPFLHLAPVWTMTNPSMTTCTQSPIEARLRIWLDPVPQSPIGQAALPPGVEAPPPQPKGPETHALHLELEILNTSQKSQSAKVISWHWSQGDEVHLDQWNVQPSMSPLNRYTQVQRQLLELKSDQLVKVAMDLDINGHSCHLQVQAQPEY